MGGGVLVPRAMSQGPFCRGSGTGWRTRCLLCLHRQSARRGVPRWSLLADLRVRQVSRLRIIRAFPPRQRYFCGGFWRAAVGFADAMFEQWLWRNIIWSTATWRLSPTGCISSRTRWVSLCLWGIKAVLTNAPARQIGPANEDCHAEQTCANTLYAIVISDKRYGKKTNAGRLLPHGANQLRCMSAFARWHSEQLARFVFLHRL